MNLPSQFLGFYGNWGSNTYLFANLYLTGVDPGDLPFVESSSIASNYRCLNGNGRIFDCKWWDSFWFQNCTQVSMAM